MHPMARSTRVGHLESNVVPKAISYRKRVSRVALWAELDQYDPQSRAQESCERYRGSRLVHTGTVLGPYVTIATNFAMEDVVIGF
jgi:hypothetical protein